MLKNEQINNSVKLIGEISTNIEFNHCSNESFFYKTTLKVKRKNDIYDLIPMIMPTRVFEQMGYNLKVGMRVSVQGTLNTFNENGLDGKSHLKIFVFVQHMSKATADDIDQNQIFLHGTLCRLPLYRKTPLGKKISEILLAVNRTYNRPSYIPCIAWGVLADISSEMEIGSKLTIKGRFQSRKYNKVLPSGLTEQRIAYEVSIWKLI